MAGSVRNGFGGRSWLVCSDAYECWDGRFVSDVKHIVGRGRERRRLSRYLMTRPTTFLLHHPFQGDLGRDAPVTSTVPAGLGIHSCESKLFEVLAGGGFSVGQS